MTDLQPVPGIPALKIGDTLVIGDLHIGVEATAFSFSAFSRRMAFQSSAE